MYRSTEDNIDNMSLIRMSIVLHRMYIFISNNILAHGLVLGPLRVGARRRLLASPALRSSLRRISSLGWATSTWERRAAFSSSSRASRCKCRCAPTWPMDIVPILLGGEIHTLFEQRSRVENLQGGYLTKSMIIMKYISSNF